MSNKIILVRANALDEAFCLDWATLELTPELQENLRARRDALSHPTEPDFVSYRDTSVEFICHEDNLNDEVDDTGVEAPFWDDKIEEDDLFAVDVLTRKDLAGAPTVSVECERMILTHAGVYWRAIVKYTNVYVETETLSWEVLLS